MSPCLLRYGIIWYQTTRGRHENKPVSVVVATDLCRMLGRVCDSVRILYKGDGPMTDDDKQIRRAIIESASDITDAMKSRPKAVNVPNSALGLCARCGRRSSFETRYGSTYAKCTEFGKTLNHADPVEKCTEFWDLSYKPVRDLIGFATLIDLKRKIGFSPYDED